MLLRSSRDKRLGTPCSADRVICDDFKIHSQSREAKGGKGDTHLKDMCKELSRQEKHSQKDEWQEGVCAIQIWRQPD